MWWVTRYELSQLSARAVVAARQMGMGVVDTIMAGRWCPRAFRRRAGGAVLWPTDVSQWCCYGPPIIAQLNGAGKE